jgi:hypothetical protein
MLARLDFCKAFIRDVDWFAKGMGAILFQKDGR